ncbi:hypothetical protein CEQ07_06855 [Oligella urethralis]|uniref:hypothetical protein n=1 Tax=Oligella urethralis TaxID=90245 RepID=UPI000D0113B9|nr:hypothetical protein [Oligella urethralis]AVL71162.1 hypothetical protein CEQ07_06855 [Oligella urethralis]
MGVIITLPLTNPLPYDLDDVDLSEYKSIADEWKNWEYVKEHAIKVSHWILDSELDKDSLEEDWER